MEALQQLGPAQLRAVITAYRDALRSHQERLNRLNVYPVPDGDTGTNMALTLESVVAELARQGEPQDGGDAEEAVEAPSEMAAACRAVSHGSLMGARGNSGVILCQILRGLAKVFEGRPEGADRDTVVEALEAAAEAAYGAMLRPVEGTILTVARAAAEGARARAGTDLVGVLEGAKEAAAEALARTPELLAVLKQAGVVDAGGAGLVLLFDAFLLVAAGRPLPPPPAGEAATVPFGQAASTGGQAASGGGGSGAGEGSGAGGPRYEVMYLLDAPDSAMAAFKQAWSAIGDSIAVVGGDGTWNCHIHTDDIGAAVEAALDAGRPHRIRVTDLEEEVAEERWVREAGTGAPASAAAGASAPAGAAAGGGPAGADHEGQTRRTAVVAVANGTGLERLFRALGVQAVVAGGQTSNPSTADLLEAVEAVGADQVVLVPNNANITAVAEQVDGLSAKTVRVVATAGVPEGLAALLAYDPGAGADENARAMAEAAGRVTAGEVTRAVRASPSPAGPIAEGDHLGLSRQGIEVVAQSLGEAATALLAKLVTDEHEIVTVIEGAGVAEGDTRRITEWLAEHRPRAVAEVHQGGQPLYPYLFSIE